jgi:hypothetical protein
VGGKGDWIPVYAGMTIKDETMRKIIKYSLLTCLIAYVLAAIAMFIFAISQTGWSRIDSDSPIFIVDMLTLGLSNYSCWGDFWYLAALVPWLGSSLVLALVLKRFARTAARRAMWAGLSVALYYVVVLLVFAIGKVIAFWGNIEVHPGDFAYVLLLIWPIGGFVVGYFSAMITDKIIKLPGTN